MRVTRDGGQKVLEGRVDSLYVDGDNLCVCVKTFANATPYTVIFSKPDREALVAMEEVLDVIIDIEESSGEQS